jgi:hypothetical protein
MTCVKRTATLGCATRVPLLKHAPLGRADAAFAEADRESGHAARGVSPAVAVVRHAPSIRAMRPTINS